MVHKWSATANWSALTEFDSATANWSATSTATASGPQVSRSDFFTVAAFKPLRVKTSSSRLQVARQSQPLVVYCESVTTDSLVSPTSTQATVTVVLCFKFVEQSTVTVYHRLGFCYLARKSTSRLEL